MLDREPVANAALFTFLLHSIHFPSLPFFHSNYLRHFSERTKSLDKKSHWEKALATRAVLIAVLFLVAMFLLAPSSLLLSGVNGNLRVPFLLRSSGR